MKKILVKIVTVLLITAMLAGCSKSNSSENVDGKKGEANSSANEDFFEWDETIITGLTAKGSKQKDLVIPAKCTEFRNIVFEQSAVETVVFEDDDDLILGLAFSEAPKLKSIVLPANLTIIGEFAFMMVPNLKEITIPEKVVELRQSAFAGCEALEKVTFLTTGLKSIENSCFLNCPVLSEVQLSEGIENLEMDSFARCPSLTTIKFPNSIKNIGPQVFNNTKLETAYFPELILVNFH